MKLNNSLFYVLLLLSQISFGQTVAEKLIHAKINANATSIEGINVVNLVSKKKCHHGQQ